MTASEDGDGSGTGSRSSAGEDRQRAFLKQANDYGASLPKIAVGGPGRPRMAFSAPNRVSAWRVLTIASKEPETIAWIDRMDAGAVLYDVGANIGLFSVYAAVARGCRVFAFEPEARNFGQLNHNIALNRLGDRCLAYCLGLSDSAGLGRILLTHDELGASGHQVQGSRAGSIAGSGRDARPQGIQTVTLDALVHEHGFPMPEHVKIDVDGLEHAIVDGGGRVFSDSRLRSVMIELSVKVPAHAAVIERLEAHGLRADRSLLAQVHAKTSGNAHNGNVLFERV